MPESNYTSLASSSEWITESNALDKSLYKTSMLWQESKENNQSVTHCNKFDVGERPDIKPCWEGDSRLLEDKYIQIWASIIRSISLQTMLVIDIGW